MLLAKKGILMMYEVQEQCYITNDLWIWKWDIRGHDVI